MSNLSRLTKYFLVSGICLLLLAGFSRTEAQIHPREVPAEVLNRSIASVVGEPSQLQVTAFPVSNEMRRGLKLKSRKPDALPDTLYLGRLSKPAESFFLLIGEAPSKMANFSFAVYFQAKGNIRAVDVLVYREERGSEIRYPAFRQQFEGQINPRKIIFGRTIQGISGATISSRSLTYGVRDLLTLFQLIREHENLP